MKKTKLLTLAFVLILMFALTMVASAAAAGPFDTLEDAVGNRIWLQREYVIGGIPYWGGVGIGGEGPFNLANDDVDLKYGADGGKIEEAGGWFCIWKYDKAYIADSFIFATANDNEQYPRRMGDGWTISGGNSADGPWTVLYTGKTEDYEPLNFTFYRIDLPNNNQEFQFYRLFSEEGGDDGAIQLSVAGVTVKGAAVVVKDPAPFTVKAADFIAYAGWEGSTDGNARRTDLIDGNEIEVAIETGGSAFGSNVGWTDKGEWLEYHVNAPGKGRYVAKAWLASDSGTNEGMEILFKNEVFGASGPVAKKGWQVYDLYTLGEIDLVAGIQTIKVDLLSGGFNIAALEFVPVGWVDTAPAEVAAPAEATPAAEEAPAAAVVEAAPAPAPVAVKPAKTGDIGILVLLANMAGAGVVIFRKKSK